MNNLNNYESDIFVLQQTLNRYIDTPEAASGLQYLIEQLRYQVIKWEREALKNSNVIDLKTRKRIFTDVSSD